MVYLDMSLNFNKNNINGYVYGFLFLLPIVFIYIYFFNESMYVALDRSEYLYIMDYPFQGREEPFLHFLSYLLGFVVSSSSLKILIIQTSFFLLLIITIIKKFKVFNVVGLIKALICLFVFFIVFSNMLGVQLRIGYGVVIFLFIVFFLDKKPNIINIPIFLLPCLMHFGLVFAILIYYLFYWLNINNFKRFFLFSLMFIIFSTFLIKLLPMFLSIIGVSSYYNYYLEGENELGRAFPYSVIFYLASISTYFLFLSKIEKNFYGYFYGLSGLLLLYTGFFLNLYISFKMLIPISAFMYIFILSQIKFSLPNLAILITLIFFPISFFMLAIQMGLYS